MTIKQLIDELLRLSGSVDEDAQVGCQSSGCCPHAHPVQSVELVNGEIVIRV